MLKRITRVVVESEDLEVLTVACGLSAELLTTDFTLFYMTQQDGFIDKVQALCNLTYNSDLSDAKARQHSRCSKEAKRVMSAARA